MEEFEYSEKINDVYPETINLQTYREEKRSYWAVVFLE